MSLVSPTARRLPTRAFYATAAMASRFNIIHRTHTFGRTIAAMGNKTISPHKKLLQDVVTRLAQREYHDILRWNEFSHASWGYVLRARLVDDNIPFSFGTLVRKSSGVMDFQKLLDLQTDDDEQDRERGIHFHGAGDEWKLDIYFNRVEGKVIYGEANLRRQAHQWMQIFII